MDDRDRLAFYPFVVVRIACRVCSRNGAYRPSRKKPFWSLTKTKAYSLR